MKLKNRYPWRALQSWFHAIFRVANELDEKQKSGRLSGLSFSCKRGGFFLSACMMNGGWFTYRRHLLYVDLCVSKRRDAWATSDSIPMMLSPILYHKEHWAQSQPLKVLQASNSCIWNVLFSLERQVGNSVYKLRTQLFNLRILSSDAWSYFPPQLFFLKWIKLASTMRGNSMI